MWLRGGTCAARLIFYASFNIAIKVTESIFALRLLFVDLVLSGLYAFIAYNTVSRLFAAYFLRVVIFIRLLRIRASPFRAEFINSARIVLLRYSLRFRF